MRVKIEHGSDEKVLELIDFRKLDEKYSMQGLTLKEKIKILAKHKNLYVFANVRATAFVSVPLVEIDEFIPALRFFKVGDEDFYEPRYVIEPEVPTFTLEDTGSAFDGEVTLFVREGKRIHKDYERLPADPEFQEQLLREEHTVAPGISVSVCTKDSLQAEFKQVCIDAIDTYNKLRALGICKKDAMKVLPQGVMAVFSIQKTLLEWAYILQTNLLEKQGELEDAFDAELHRKFPICWGALSSLGLGK